MATRRLNIEIKGALMGFLYSDRLGRYVRLTDVVNAGEAPSDPVVIAEVSGIKGYEHVLPDMPRGKNLGNFIDWRKNAENQLVEEGKGILSLMKFPESFPPIYSAYVFNNSGEVVEILLDERKVRHYNKRK